MHFKQFYLGCLAHASYLIGSGEEAVVVDPQRDVELYIDEAKRLGLRIRYVIETHLHADFVSGHRELAERTGAEIVFGARAQVGFPHRPVADGDELTIGRTVLRFLETPGHTPESISILVIDKDGPSEPRMVLTGDTLFIGDVGRPDLVGAKGHSAEEMAGMLYASLHDKLLTLSDRVEVYPAHGAGSLCGRNISKETSSTIGEQRRFNYALRPMPQSEFVRLMTTDLPEVPAYFSRDVELNRQGAPALLQSEPSPLPPAQVEILGEKGAVLLDIRSSSAFGAGHLPGSLNIGLVGQFASWSGALIPAERPVVLVAEDKAGAVEATLRLARVGLGNVVGYLEGGIASWASTRRPLAATLQITVDELKARLEEDETLGVLDVRRPAEFAAGRVPRARNVPLDRVEREAPTLDAGRTFALICAGGYRSSAAASLLARGGFGHLLNVVGGTAAWVQAGHCVEAG